MSNNNEKFENKGLAIVESPYAGDVDGNVAYARTALLYLIQKGYTPLASHLLYTQVLDDDKPGDRERGIQMQIETLIRTNAKVFFFVDKGFSSGMKKMANVVYERNRMFDVERNVRFDIVSIFDFFLLKRKIYEIYLRCDNISMPIEHYGLCEYATLFTKDDLVHLQSNKSNEFDLADYELKRVSLVDYIGSRNLHFGHDDISKQDGRALSLFNLIAGTTFLYNSRY